MRLGKDRTKEKGNEAGGKLDQRERDEGIFAWGDK